MPIDSTELSHIILAIIVGGLIGGEREFRDKAAGIRTNIFICVGATLFTMFSIKIAGYNDPTRIAANIVSGIGFLGAGVIMRDHGKVTGLTTASTIWVVAALGMGIGAGFILFSLICAGIILIVLLFFPVFDSLLREFRDTKNYRVVAEVTKIDVIRLEKTVHESGLHIRNYKVEKSMHDLTFSWEGYGSPKKHLSLSNIILDNPQIKEFTS